MKAKVQHFKKWQYIIKYKLQFTAFWKSLATYLVLFLSFLFFSVVQQSESLHLLQTNKRTLLTIKISRTWPLYEKINLATLFPALPKEARNYRNYLLPNLRECRPFQVFCLPVTAILNSSQLKQEKISLIQKYIFSTKHTAN